MQEDRGVIAGKPHLCVGLFFTYQNVVEIRTSRP